jgi:asparagine synthase (glutamine-hydrolysing)
MGAVVSGFVGVLCLDGAPVDSRLLRGLTDFLAFRGPDAQEMWCHGSVGLGHTLLQTSCEAAPEKQPFQLDGRLWIVADARIDARAELIEKLKSKSNAAYELSPSSPDSELILHAFDTWGEACVEHLLGDFSFAIYDARGKRLYCARDQMGVKPFYYARLASHFIFSNTLNCVRMHPGISNRLNDLAIANFLLFDSNMDLATTTFADIQRLPPAHALVCEPEKLSVRRYWTLSVTTPIHYSRNEEYVERFRELLDTAVADRLRTESAGVLMSGGLDSSTIAASAQRVFKRNGKASGVHAYTLVYDRLIPHEERHYARLVADALQIPITFLPNDDCKLFEHAEQPEYHPTEPSHLAWSAADPYRPAATRCRVLLTGDGGDPVFSNRISVHFRRLLEKKQFGRALGDAARYLGAEGRISRLYLRKRWGLLFPSKNQAPQFPEWLSEDLQSQCHLRDRWESQSPKLSPADAVRPEAQLALEDPTWPVLFEGYDAGEIHAAVDTRHPFFDLRLMNFLLALPRLPWCSDKELLREAARGVLPDAVRLRRKSPLQADPLIVLLARPEASWVDRFEPIPGLERYIVRNRIPKVHGETDSWTAWLHLRPLSLNFWLRRSTR